MKTIFAALALLIAGSALSDTSVGTITYGSASLKRGSTTVATINPATQQACTDRAQIDAESRDATTAYTCGNFAFTVAWSAAPVICPGTPPADTSKTISCSSPYFGTRQITQSWTLHQTPTCWVNDGPISPPADTVPPCLTSPPSGTYTTTFSVAESPLSEGGVWNHNGTAWSKVAVSPAGLAHSTQAGGRSGSNVFNDSYAYLSGFGANQSIEGTIALKTGIQSVDREVELLLRVSDTTSTAKAYEINYSYTGRYAQIVRWNGAIGNYTELLTITNTTPPKTGDKIKATMIGQQITVYFNGTQIMQVSDNTYTSGQPGIGFFIDSGGAPLEDYGFSSVTATQLP